MIKARGGFLLRLIGRWPLATSYLARQCQMRSHLRTGGTKEGSMRPVLSHPAQCCWRSRPPQPLSKRRGGWSAGPFLVAPAKPSARTKSPIISVQFVPVHHSPDPLWTDRLVRFCPCSRHSRAFLLDVEGGRRDRCFCSYLCSLSSFMMAFLQQGLSFTPAKSRSPMPLLVSLVDRRAPTDVPFSPCSRHHFHCRVRPYW